MAVDGILAHAVALPEAAAKVTQHSGTASASGTARLLRDLKRAA